MRVAALQMISTPNTAENLATAARLMAEAKAQGAELVVLPEYFFLITQDARAKVEACEQLLPADYRQASLTEQHAAPLQIFLAKHAQQLGLWVAGGSIPLTASVPDKMRNTTLVYNPQGQRVTRYDKVHLFSFDNGHERYDEAATMEAGDHPVRFSAPCGEVGLSICYDLRFPEYFRALGPVSLLILPAAFTYTTGKAHWEILLRARAIENQCYVLACGQGGLHPTGRRTFGHSMLIDPWGEIVALQAEGEGVVIGEVDLQRIAEVRRNLPALQHRQCL